MRMLSLMVLASALVVGGCASTNPADGTKVAAAGEESYTPLGSIIPKKGPKGVADNKSADLQQLENARIMNNGNSGH